MESLRIAWEEMREHEQGRKAAVLALWLTFVAQAQSEYDETPKARTA